VELLVRLHMSGFFWGDCSLSNTLYRHDAGTLEAYLVDAETSEQQPTLSSGQREYDVGAGRRAGRRRTARRSMTRVIAAIPEDLRDRLQPAEIFSEVLEHRWYMSETAGRDVGTTAATRDFIEQVLPGAPAPLTETLGDTTGPLDAIAGPLDEPTVAGGETT
jgi:Domain of unknown function (DUF4032)